MNKYITVVRENYSKGTHVFNWHGEPDESEQGWECVVLPPFLGVYVAESNIEAILDASGDHGIVPEAILAIEV